MIPKFINHFFHSPVAAKGRASGPLPGATADAGALPTGPGSTSGSNLKREGHGLFSLGQNFPNPYSLRTTIPFTLNKAAEVKLALFDPLGRKITGVIRKEMHAGDHGITLNLEGLGLNAGNYVYQLQIRNAHGVHCQQKVMTVS